MRTKARVLTEKLPATPVTPEMRDEITSIATKRGCSLAEVQREAFSLFLRENVILNDITVTLHEQGVLT